MRLLAVHGVNTSASEPVASLWESILREEGIACEMTDCRWPSTGDFVKDAAAFTLPQFREDAVESVVHGMQDFAAGGFGVVLAHSMGTVLALHANRLAQIKLPILCLASPLSNPAIAPALIAIGFGRLPAEPVIHIWNDDDPIPGGMLADQPKCFQATRIAVADNEAKAFDSEHNVELYLRHTHTHNALRLLWERGGGDHALDHTQ